MEVTSLEKGIIIDHVPAGTALKVLQYIDVDPSCTKVALIMNTDSRRLGTKDIIKIEGIGEDDINLDVLGLVASGATVDVVSDGRIARKLAPSLPEHVTGVIRCPNPRCVTSTERDIEQGFHLVTLGGRQEYRCDYCDEEATF